jgi:type I restriction enzyme S subunit
MQNNTWRYVRGEDFCARVTDGTHDTPKQVECGKYLITSKHIKGDQVDFDSAYFISEEDFNEINKRSKVDQWDVIISMIGAYCGFCFIERNLKINYAVKNVGLYKCGNEVNAKWLYYYLNSPTGKTYLEAAKSGSTQPYIALGALRDLPILIPKNEDIKRKIVNVVDCIDNKIRTNNCINAELEAMAKTLYDYWFVQFDFPFDFAQDKPDKNGKPYKSSGGKMVYNPTLKREIPKGWRHSTIGEIFKTHLGGTPSREKEEYWTPSEVNWLSSGENPSTFVVDPDEQISKQGLQNSAAKLLPQGTVILSIVRHLRASILGIEAATNQSVVGILETDKFKHCFIYPYLVREIPRLMTLRTGAQQPHINKGVLDESLLLLPDETIIETYTNLATPLFSQIKNYHQQNRELTQLRDWLLPMLMNGQVTVA